MRSRSDPLATLLRATLAMVFALVVWGGIVRLSGSGLAIPDWPLAEGKLLPRPQPNVLIEYGHRVLAMLVGSLTLVVVVLTFRSRQHRERVGALAVAALLTVSFQVVLGGRVVLEELPIDRVVAHLLVAFLFFGILLAMALRVTHPEGPAERNPRVRSLARHSHVAAGAVFLQAGLGAWVSSSGAALACPDFPTCQGSWLPPMEGLVGIHYAHRLGAYAVVLLILWLLLAAAPARLKPRARWPLRVSGILLAVQVLLGIGNVLWRVPLPVSAAHLGVALALFGSLLVAGHELSRA